MQRLWEEGVPSRDTGMRGWHNRGGGGGDGWRVPVRGNMGSQVDMKGAPDGDPARDALRRAWGDIEAGVGLGEPGGEEEPRTEGNEATTRAAGGRHAGQGSSGPHGGPPRTTPRVVMVATEGKSVRGGTAGDRGWGPHSEWGWLPSRAAHPAD